ncbi:MAG: glutathione peroxidase [Clostridia bacterium]|nr:glutathione peroxidase [Clostridia bacterium]
MASIYDFSVKTASGEDLSLSEYKGKVILVVNTATGCGFTPQYAPIEQLYKDYHDKGLEILDIPCNQFGNQAPGTDEEIHEFCTLHYNTTFPQMKKTDVNGETADPLFVYLAAEKPFQGFGKGVKNAMLEKFSNMNNKAFGDKAYIRWNFTKFVIDREGNIVARFEPTAEMADVEACIKSLL